MKNKKGILMKNVLSLVIAVLGIFLIAYLIYRLYAIGVAGEEERAKETLSIIEGKIDALKEGDAGKFLIRGVSDENEWYLVGWNKDNSITPDKCFFDSCICVCKSKIGFCGYARKYHENRADFLSSLAADCQENGFCRKLDRKVFILKPYDYEFRRFIATTTESDDSEIIPLKPTSFFEIEITKGEQLISVKDPKEYGVCG